MVRPIPHYKAPLFDRLVDHEPKIPTEVYPFRTFDESALIRSIERELYFILNTRDCRIPFGNRTIPEDFIDPNISNSYGLADFNQFDITHQEGMYKLLLQVKRQVELYEPRLAEVDVILLGSDTTNQRLVVEISAAVTVAEVPFRYAFPVAIERFGDS